MASFDIVSEVDKQELRNAVDQANKEIGARFDFKGSDFRVEVGPSARCSNHARRQTGHRFESD
jgi:uncharacterized protein YajQ (UPF0234 family)